MRIEFIYSYRLDLEQYTASTAHIWWRRANGKCGIFACIRVFNPQHCIHFFFLLLYYYYSSSDSSVQFTTICFTWMNTVSCNRHNNSKKKKLKKYEHLTHIIFKIFNHSLAFHCTYMQLCCFPHKGTKHKQSFYLKRDADRTFH